MWTEKFQMFKLYLEKAEEPAINLSTSLDHRKSNKILEKHLLFYWLHQTLWLCGSQQTGKSWKRWEYQTTWPAIWEICMHVKKQHLEPDMEQQTGSKYWDTICTGKVVNQGCIWSPFLVNFFAEYMMQNARLDEAPAGIKIAGRNINSRRYTDDTTLMSENEELKSLWWK